MKDFLGNLKSFKYKRLLTLFLVPLGFILTNLAYQYPYKTEKYFTHGVYKLYTQIFGRFFGSIPFSTTEYLVLTGIVFLLLTIIKFFYDLFRKKSKKHGFISFLANLLTFLSCLYFLFVIFCGLNYARPHYKDLVDLPVQPSSIEELESLCVNLIKDANDQHTFISPIVQRNDYNILAQQSQEIYIDYAKSHTSLFFSYSPKPKSVLNSKLMSRVDITGVYFPYTFECNINSHVPSFTIPATMLHEISHFHGFMQESEANFLSYKISQQEKYPEFAYSGTIMALINSTNAYHSATSSEKYSELLSLLSPKVQADLYVNHSYWKQFDTPIADFGQKVNDTYLKSHNQKDGVKSYGKMVDLLLADERQKKTS